MSCCLQTVWQTVQHFDFSLCISLPLCRICSLRVTRPHLFARFSNINIAPNTRHRCRLLSANLQRQNTYIWRGYSYAIMYHVRSHNPDQYMLYDISGEFVGLRPTNPQTKIRSRSVCWSAWPYTSTFIHSYLMCLCIATFLSFMLVLYNWYLLATWWMYSLYWYTAHKKSKMVSERMTPFSTIVLLRTSKSCDFIDTSRKSYICTNVSCFPGRT